MFAKEGSEGGAGGPEPLGLASFCISKMGTALPRRVVPSSPGSARRRAALPQASVCVCVCAPSPRTGNLCRLISLILLIKTIDEPASPLRPPLFFAPESLESESGGMLVLRNQILLEKLD